MSDIWQQINSGMDNLVYRLRHSVVHVSNGADGQGSGIVWTEDGLIVTNAHVMRHDVVQATLWDGRTLPARLLAYDQGYDLALLAVRARGLEAIPLGSANDLRPGAWVAAMGFPWGVPDGLTAGVVIGVGRHPGITHYPGDLVKVSFHLRPGHSGGPLVNSRGELVGINTMIAGPEVGLAIPVHIAKAFVHQAIEQRMAA
jgi:S1-C subfamily serine protease